MTNRDSRELNRSCSKERNVRQNSLIQVIVWMIVGGFAVGTSSGARADVTLTFGASTSESPIHTIRKLRPVLNVLEKKLSIELGERVTIHSRVPKTYIDGIWNLVSGDVDFARLGAVSYIEAKKKNGDISLLAIESNKGHKFHNGVIFANASSRIAEISDLKGQTVAFASEWSTSGRYLAQLELLKQGVRAGNLAAYSYLERHDRVGRSVGIGSFDAGALDEAVYQRVLTESDAPLRVIARFPTLNRSWVSREGLPKRIADALKKGLLELKDQSVLEALGGTGFLPASEQDFSPVRLAMKKNAEFQSLFENASSETVPAPF